MSDTATIVDHERRLTGLEHTNDRNAATIEARLTALEQHMKVQQMNEQRQRDAEVNRLREENDRLKIAASEQAIPPKAQA